MPGAPDPLETALKGRRDGPISLDDWAGGIPQTRRHMYTVAILADGLRGEFIWPPPIPCLPSSDFVDLSQDVDPTRRPVGPTSDAQIPSL